MQGVQEGTTHVSVDRLALAIAVFVVAQAVLVRFATYASGRLGERVLAELREEFVDRVLAIPLSTVERAGTGDLVTRTSRDVRRAVHSRAPRGARDPDLLGDRGASRSARCAGRAAARAAAA